MQSAPGQRLMMYHPPDEIARKMQIDELDGVLHVGDGPPTTRRERRARIEDRSHGRDRDLNHRSYQEVGFEPQLEG